jgi:hypothetical protein
VILKYCLNFLCLSEPSQAVAAVGDAAAVLEGTIDNRRFADLKILEAIERLGLVLASVVMSDVAARDVAPSLVVKRLRKQAKAEEEELLELPACMAASADGVNSMLGAVMSKAGLFQEIARKAYKVFASNLFNAGKFVALGAAVAALNAEEVESRAKSPVPSNEVSFFAAV